MVLDMVQRRQQYPCRKEGVLAVGYSVLDKVWNFVMRSWKWSPQWEVLCEESLQ